MHALPSSPAPRRPARPPPRLARLGAALACLLLALGGCSQARPYLEHTTWQAHALKQRAEAVQLQPLPTAAAWQEALAALQAQGYRLLATTRGSSATAGRLRRQDPRQQRLLALAQGLRATRVLTLAAPPQDAAAPPATGAPLQLAFLVQAPRLLLVVEPTTVPETGLTGLLVLKLQGKRAIPSGLLKGDVILEVDGKTIRAPQDLIFLPQQPELPMTLLRFGKIATHTIYLP